MTTPTVHPDPSHPGTLYLDLHDGEGSRFFLSRHDARQFGHVLLAATDPADENPMRWANRVEQDADGHITTTSPPPGGWPVCVTALIAPDPSSGAMPNMHSTSVRPAIGHEIEPAEGGGNVGAYPYYGDKTRFYGEAAAAVWGAGRVIT